MVNPILMIKFLIKGTPRIILLFFYLILFISLYCSIVGPMFMKAARLINARVKMDTFDLSAIEIRSSDFKPFIKSLQNIVNVS